MNRFGCSKALREALGEPTRTMRARHRDVIRRFGRFPHRNAVLGRINTPEEEAYLAQPGAGLPAFRRASHERSRRQDHESALAISLSLPPRLGEAAALVEFRRDATSRPAADLREGRGRRQWRRLCAVPRGASGDGVRRRGQLRLVVGRRRILRLRARLVDRPRPGKSGSPIPACIRSRSTTPDGTAAAHARHAAARRARRSMASRSTCRPASRCIGRRVFVSDGYGNRRVHCFSADGDLKHSWGEPGDGPGQFALVHFIAADADDRLYVATAKITASRCSPHRRSARAWTGFKMPSDLAFGREVIYVAGADGVSIWTQGPSQAYSPGSRRTVRRAR